MREKEMNNEPENGGEQLRGQAVSVMCASVLCIWKQ